MTPRDNLGRAIEIAEWIAHCRRLRNLTRTLKPIYSDNARGTDGPPPPDPIPEGLDEQTANGAGPVIMIWCEGETNGQGVLFPVPTAVWSNMIRDWED